MKAYCFLVLALLSILAVADTNSLDNHFRFAGESVDAGGTLRRVTVWTRAGNEAVHLPTAPGETLLPVSEGLYVLTLGEAGELRERRVLVASRPSAASPSAIRAALPRQGERLLAGNPYMIVAMGDSVTATGGYEYMLAKLMTKATGNGRLTVVTRAYPGRSVDASVRHFARDMKGITPHLVLIMYGLNDQGAGTPLDAYLGQTDWLVRRCREQFDADVLLLTPTPHPQLRTEGKPLDHAVRTIGFAGALEQLGVRLDAPVVDTYAALWGTGGARPETAVTDLWPLYPPHYAKQYRTLLEQPTGGDMIHPNALGHLALARGVWSTINGDLAAPSLAFEAKTEWAAEGAVSTLTVSNRSATSRRGLLHLASLRGTGPLRFVNSDGRYKLGPDESAEFQVRWEAVREPLDLVRHPGNVALSQDLAQLGIIDFAGGQSRVYAVPAPWVDWPIPRRDRQVVDDRAAVTFSDGHVETVELPQDRPSGRLVVNDGRHVAEVTYCRMGAVIEGGATVDGNLDEWAEQPREPLGLPHQARWTQGQADHREDPADCFLEWAFRAGSDGLYISFRTDSRIDGDRFTLYFDPRSAEKLGTYGRYYWVGGQIKGGRLHVRPGETSSVRRGLKGALGDDGGEVFVPYTMLDIETFPASGDLGYSMHWMHHGEGGRTSLLWAEDGHPWNSRWYGVIRRVPADNPDRPFVVRVK